MVQGTPSYQALEQGRLPSFAVLDEGAAIGDHDLSVEMAQAVEEMASHFPGLMRRPLTATNPNSDGNSSSSSSTSASTGATAVAFDWLVANDYFACRTANALEDTIPGSLLRHEAIVRCILAHRYGLYFAHPTKSAHFAVPLLVDILESLGEGQTSTDTEVDSETDTGGVDVYSCHDVNLLGMLFALRCPLVTHPNGNSMIMTFNITFASTRFKICILTHSSSLVLPSLPFPILLTQVITDTQCTMLRTALSWAALPLCAVCLLNAASYGPTMAPHWFFGDNTSRVMLVKLGATGARVPGNFVSWELR